ncbi:MAG: hypothetical protein LUG12_03665 [Erysipelotrichaceae bacterium]|nr:hypothetical protein [Erysipelotrichaceae bacterium]
MKELSLTEQCSLQGGSVVATVIIYVLLGAGIYKIIKSTSGRISIPKLVSIEWKSS